MTNSSTFSWPCSSLPFFDRGNFRGFIWPLDKNLYFYWTSTWWGFGDMILSKWLYKERDLFCHTTSAAEVSDQENNLIFCPIPDPLLTTFSFGFNKEILCAINDIINFWAMTWQSPLWVKAIWSFICTGIPDIINAINHFPCNIKY